MYPRRLDMELWQVACEIGCQNHAPLLSHWEELILQGADPTIAVRLRSSPLKAQPLHPELSAWEVAFASWPLDILETALRRAPVSSFPQEEFVFPGLSTLAGSEGLESPYGGSDQMIWEQLQLWYREARLQWQATADWVGPWQALRARRRELEAMDPPAQDQIGQAFSRFAVPRELTQLGNATRRKEAIRWLEREAQMILPPYDCHRPDLVQMLRFADPQVLSLVPRCGNLATILGPAAVARLQQLQLDQKTPSGPVRPKGRM